jgi:hypothetical protein
VIWSLRNKESRKPGREIGIALTLSIGPGKRRVRGTGVAWLQPGRPARRASRNSWLRCWLPGFLISRANCSSEAANGNVASRGTSVVIVDRANVAVRVHRPGGGAMARSGRLGRPSQSDLSLAPDPPSGKPRLLPARSETRYRSKGPCPRTACRPVGRSALVFRAVAGESHAPLGPA